MTQVGSSVGQRVSTQQPGSLRHACVLVYHSNAQNTKDIPTCSNKVGGLTHIATAFENNKKKKLIEDFVRVNSSVSPVEVQ